MPAGRPTKYKKEFCEVVVKVGERGDTITAMAEACDIHKETLRDWMAAHPEFSVAVNRGLQKAQAWWEQKGKEMAVGDISAGNPTTYIFNMKNRFKEDWRDKHEVDNTSSDGSMKMPTEIIIRGVEPGDGN